MLYVAIIELDRGAVCRAMFVIYVAFLPFFPLVSAGAQKKRLCRFFNRGAVCRAKFAIYVALIELYQFDCHSERSRGEGCKDRKEKAIPRRSRSFAKKERCVSTVRSKTKGCFAPSRDMVGS